MPRQPRLDPPGALHHIMDRGIKRARIFRMDQDREDFLNRLADLCINGGLIVYAWSLMPNHFHLLARTGRQSISIEGGLIRSLGGWSQVLSFRRKGIKVVSDERV